MGRFLQHQKKIHNQRAAQTIEPPSSRARENSNTAGAGKPSSRESQRGDDLGRGGGRASENVGIEHAPPGIGEEATTRYGQGSRCANAQK